MSHNWTLGRYGHALLRAPGVYVHEWAHYIVCKLLGVHVDAFVAFRFASPVGYVSHEVPRSYLKRILISVAPILVNTLVGVVAIWSTTQVSTAYVPVLLYLGVVSIHESIPSSVDARNLFPNSKLGWLHPLVLPTLLVIGTILGVNRLRPYGAVLVYTTVATSALMLYFHTSLLAALPVF